MKPLIFFSLIIVFWHCTPKNEYTEWDQYLGDKARTHYSSLNNIDTSNVHLLQVAWTYSSGNADPQNRSQIQCSPIAVNGILYGTNPVLHLFALDASTGKEIWKFIPDSQTGNHWFGVNRGVTYWDDGQDGRIIYASGNYLYAVDALTGQLEESFGQSGKVDLREGLGRPAEEQSVVANTPGVIYNNLLIQGTRVHEGPGASPGHIRAYNLNTGNIEWTFHTIPQPGEFGYDTWPEDAWKNAGGANSWAGMALDEEAGMVYIPTGSASFDFYGGNRHGANLFANCLLALNAKTGKRVWHFQFVHHDLWDRDLPAPPNLVNLGKIKAVAQVTKSGHVFLFDRLTGEPLFPIEEIAAPSSDLEDEKAWPTQPLPTKIPPFARQHFPRDQIYDLFNSGIAQIYDSLRSEGGYLPPSEQGNIFFPGFDGGAEWGGAGVDPNKGILYVNSNEMPWIFKMRKNETMQIGKQLADIHCSRCHGGGLQGLNGIPALTDVHTRFQKEELREVVIKGKGAMQGLPHLSAEEVDAITAYLMKDTTTVVVADNQRNMLKYSMSRFERFVDQRGYPAIQPPWGTLNAIDLHKGEILWQVPLGEFKELTDMGIGKTGTENYGGPVITAGHLIFIAATKDQKIRAFHKDTGEELWVHDLPAGGYATPITYHKDGKQYLVIACGGGKMGTPSGDQYVAFTLAN